MKKGARVQFTATLGTLETPESARFCGEVHPGERGEYYGTHPNPKLAHWHLVKYRDVFVPCHISQFEETE